MKNNLRNVPVTERVARYRRNERLRAAAYGRALRRLARLHPVEFAQLHAEERESVQPPLTDDAQAR